MPVLLIVDDEKENRTALIRALRDENPEWELLQAESAAEGIIQLQLQMSKKCPVDVLLTDLVMESEQSGMFILHEARRIDPLIMAILFTAKEKSLDRYAAFDFGAFDVVEKNIRGTSAVKEVNIKTRAALRYREWSQRISFLRRYFDPRIFETIERDPALLKARSKIITISFWDIRGFSRLCEILKEWPELIAGFLRDYCETAALTIFENSGVLDKFIGDGVMALFGVLAKDDDRAASDASTLAAVRTAEMFRDRFSELSTKWIAEWARYTPQKVEIGLGCGMHTGEALVGNVGTEFRDQFTALGPHVNLASRIESRSENGEILLSQTTRSRVEGKISTELKFEIDDIKNISGIFAIYRVVSATQSTLKV